MRGGTINNTLETRLKHGSLTIDEVCLLGGVARSTFWKHRREGRVATFYVGGLTRVRGEVARRYLAGQPIADLIDKQHQAGVA